MSMMDIDKEGSPWGCFPRKNMLKQFKKLLIMETMILLM